MRNIYKLLLAEVNGLLQIKKSGSILNYVIQKLCGAEKIQKSFCFTFEKTVLLKPHFVFNTFLKMQNLNT